MTDLSRLTYDDIGRWAQAWFQAEVERVNAKNRHVLARRSHPCIFETEHSEEHPCWVNPLTSSLTSQLMDWCENCKYVQPYWLSYRAAAKNAQRLRYQLTRRIRAKMISEAEL